VGRALLSGCSTSREDEKWSWAVQWCSAPQRPPGPFMESRKMKAPFETRAGEILDPKEPPGDGER